MSFGIVRWQSAATLALLATYVACADRGADSPGEDAGTPPPSDASTLPESSSPGTEDASADARTPQRCGAGGFCAMPMPLEGPLLGVSASSLDDAWVVSQDTMARWNGASWEYVYRYTGSGAPEDRFYGIWVSKPDDVWALGDRVVVRYSKLAGAPAAARKIDIEPLSGGGSGNGATSGPGAWVTPASDTLWIASSTEIVQRYREESGGALVGDTLEPKTGDEKAGYYNWHSVWGFAPDDVYIGGDYCPGSCSFFPAQNVVGALAHYDGTAFSVTLFGENESVNAIFGPRDLGEPRQLWLWVGARSGFGERENSLRLVPVTSAGVVGAPLLSRPLDLTPMGVEGAWCERVVGSVKSASGAWFSDGCNVYRWDGATLDVTPTALGGIPLGKMNGVWANGADEAWLVGEAVPQGPDAPKGGFALRRTAADSEGGAP